MRKSAVATPKIVALIPLRGGSKRIPGKNIKPIAGKPLAYWACAAACSCRYIEDVYVSTEDQLIARTIESFALGIRVVARPESLAMDNSTTDDVMLHFMSQVDFDVLATIQATCPLVRGIDLDLGIEQFIRNENDSLLTGVLTKRFYWSVDSRPLNYDPFRRPFSQDFEGSIVENGAFYLTNRTTLQTQRNRLGGKIGIFRMAKETVTDIDDLADFEVAERQLLKRTNELRAKAGTIKILISDLDGIWGDNNVCTFGDMRELSEHSNSDTSSLDRFRAQFNLPILIVAKEANPAFKSRCAKLRVEFLGNSDDKCSAITQELTARGLSWPDVCYIGRDVSDRECMMKAGLTFCPAEGDSEIKRKADHVLCRGGGADPIREVFEVLASRLPGPHLPVSQYAHAST